MSAHNPHTIAECRAEIERLRSEHVIHAERRFRHHQRGDLALNQWRLADERAGDIVERGVFKLVAVLAAIPLLIAAVLWVGFGL